VIVQHSPEADVEDPGGWLRAQWSDLLAVPVTTTPGADPDFFALGGDSLRAARLAARMRKAGFAGIALTDVIDNRRFAQQVELLRAAATREAAPAPMSTQRYEMSAAQQNRVAMVAERLRAGQRPPPLSIHTVLALHGPIDPAALHRAARALLDRHPALRTTFLTEDFQERVLVRPVPGNWGPAVHDFTGLPVAEARRRARAIAHSQHDTLFDFVEPPLLAVSLCLVSADEALLAVTVDHLVSDGVSTFVLWRDLTALYDAETRRMPAGLPELSVSSQELLGSREAAWQAQRASLLEAWDGALAGYDAAPQCDLVDPDRAEEFHPPQPAEHHGQELPAALVREFRAACLAAEVTEHAAVVGLVFAALHALDGRTDAVVCTAQSGRFTEAEENLVGWLSDRVIVRVLGESGDPLRCVRAAQERLRFAYRNPVPYHVLVRRYQGTVGGRSPRKPYIFVNYTDAPLTGRTFGPAAAEEVVDPAPHTSFPGPGVLVARDGDRMTIELSTVAGRYPEGLVARFGEQLIAAFRGFAATAAPAAEEARA